MRWIVFAFFGLFFFFSCKKYDRVNPRDGIAGVTTSEVKQVNFSTVQISSSLTSVEGVSFISQRGVCWSTNPNPTVADAFINEGSGFGTFLSTIEGLSANTTYYFRSFASNDKTIAYGNEVSFKIIAVLNVETKAATSIGFTAATIGGTLVSNGGYTIKTKGIFWGVYPGISEKNELITVDQSDFDYQLSNLENGKTYYYRAFALTNEGYVFGEEMNFTTLGYNSPSLTTNSITNIGENSAVSGGVITSDGASPISAKGVCWSTSSNPTITDAKTNDGSGSDNFSSKLSGLQEGTTYYVRAYATNSKGTSYGNEVSFTTYTINKPIVSTNSITNITSTNATSGGTISSDGGASITVKGICWSTTSNPTIANNKTNEGTGASNFSSQLSGLQEGTTYYVRSYATNSKGTSYGNEVSFTTTAINKPIISTNSITNISISSATSGGAVSSDGGASITAKGICWSTSSNPTLSDNPTNQGIGPASFTSQLTGLKEATKYYVRAYATNSKGTSYGNEVSFTTYTINKPILSTNSITNITTTNAISGGTISSDGGASITVKGICWSTTSNPTIANNKTNEGNGVSNFSSQLSGLQEGTTYYVRSYATNSKGTSYGNEVIFSTIGIMIKGVEFVNLPAGIFIMGSPSSESGRKFDEQQHQVTLSAFKMSKNEITFEQYDAFCDATGRKKPYDGGWGRGNRPVINVSWNDVNAFANWMGCRLPTEAEWEYACRAGSTTPYNTGVNLTINQANFSDNLLRKTQPVGSYPSNAWGLNDMHGNVEEWCSDVYGAYDTGSQINPTGASSGFTFVVRGGRYDYNADRCRSAFRFNTNPTLSWSGVGIRLVAP